VRMVLYLSNNGTASSNTAQSMDMGPRSAVPCRYRPCDGPISRPRSLTKMSKRIHSFRS